MSEPRRPIFGFVFGPRAGPVDDAFTQIRPVRITRRGPWRLALLVIGTLLEVAVAGSALAAAVAAGLSPAVVIAAVLAASGLVLLLRAWVVGTSVDDSGILIERMWHRDRYPWSQVAAVTREVERCPWLGLPIRISAERVRVDLVDGGTCPTHVTAVSPDLWLRPEAYDIAATRLETWAQERR